MNATPSLAQVAAVAGVVFISGAYTHAEPTCQMVTVARNRIELSRPMRDAIARYDPTFTVWADDDYLPLVRQFYRYTDFQAPFAVIGDFNGDSVTDVVLDGRTRQFPVVIALLSTAEKRYRVSEVVRAAGTLEPAEESYDFGEGQRQFGRSVFLRRRVDRGRVQSEFLSQPLVLRQHGFEIEWFEKAATLYFVSAGKIMKVNVAD